MIRDPCLSRVKTRRTREAASQGHILGEQPKVTGHTNARSPTLSKDLVNLAKSTRKAWTDKPLPCAGCGKQAWQCITYHQHSIHNLPMSSVASRFAAGTTSSRIHYFGLPKDIVSVASSRHTDITHLLHPIDTQA